MIGRMIDSMAGFYVSLVVAFGVGLGVGYFRGYDTGKGDGFEAGWNECERVWHEELKRTGKPPRSRKGGRKR